MSDAHRYGDLLSPEREAELRALLDAWAAPTAPAAESAGTTDSADSADSAEPASVRRASPFAGVRLTGADVAWLAQPLRNPNNGTVPDLHLESADLRQAHLEGADLRFAHLEGVDLWRAHLEGACLYGAHLEDASLYETHLEGAGLFRVRLEGARLLEARLDSADLVEAHLEGARLNQARLHSADLTRAHLEGREYAADDPDLARIRAVNPAFRATLPPTDLRSALLDDATVLRDTTLCAPGARVGPQVGDTHWSGASLGARDWAAFTRRRALLGDERRARDWRARAYVAPEIPPDETAEARAQRSAARRGFRRQQRDEGIAAWTGAARANEQLARALRSQGLGDEADHFAYRAQVTRRGVLRRREAWLRWLAAGWLGLIAGYGYRFGRALALYLAVIAVYTGLYLLAAAGTLSPDVITVSQSLHAPLAWYDSLAISIAAFHGRGFLLPLRPDDLTSLLPISESFIGLFIELGVGAAFARRYLMGR